MSLPLIETERLILRMGTEADIPSILAYYAQNRDRLKSWMGDVPDEFYKSETYWQRRLEASTKEFKEDRGMRLFVFSRESADTVVGTVNFTTFIRGAFQACFMGYGIAKEYEGNGYMYEAIRSGITYVFRDLNLHRIMANHVPENVRSARLLRRLGFDAEGLARDYLRLNGEWKDHVMNSLTNRHWKPGPRMESGPLMS